MPTRPNPSKSPEVREKIAASLRRVWAEGRRTISPDQLAALHKGGQRWREEGKRAGTWPTAAFLAVANRRAVTFDPDMRRVAIEGYHAGKGVATLAHEIGVGERRLRRFWRDEGLGPRKRGAARVAPSVPVCEGARESAAPSSE